MSLVTAWTWLLRSLFHVILQVKNVYSLVLSKLNSCRVFINNWLHKVPWTYYREWEFIVNFISSFRFSAKFYAFNRPMLRG